MAQGKGWRCGASLAVVIALGCGGHNGDEYAKAAVGVAGVIGGTAIYRAQTHGCWAICSAGYACDQSSGTCKRTECMPACAPNETCFIEANDSFRCVDTLGTWQLGASPSAPITSSAPVSSATPPASSASPN